jgi:hypothetical protein
MLFLERDPPVTTFQRLMMMIRGVTDPLASAYVRLYLARRLQAILPAETGTSLNKFFPLFELIDCSFVGFVVLRLYNLILC